MNELLSFILMVLIGTVTLVLVTIAILFVIAWIYSKLEEGILNDD